MRFMPHRPFYAREKTKNTFVCIVCDLLTHDWKFHNKWPSSDHFTAIQKCCVSFAVQYIYIYTQGKKKVCILYITISLLIVGQLSPNFAQRLGYIIVVGSTSLSNKYCSSREITPWSPFTQIALKCDYFTHVRWIIVPDSLHLSLLESKNLKSSGFFASKANHRCWKMVLTWKRNGANFR